MWFQSNLLHVYFNITDTDRYVKYFFTTRFIHFECFVMKSSSPGDVRAQLQPNAGLLPPGSRAGDFHMQRRVIHKLSFNENHLTFTSILLIDILLWIKFPWTKLMDYKWFVLKSSSFPSAKPSTMNHEAETRDPRLETRTPNRSTLHPTPSS
jgi:hypothetical protein